MCRGRGKEEGQPPNESRPRYRNLDPRHGLRACHGFGGLYARLRGAYSHGFRATRGNEGNLSELVNSALKAIRSRRIYRNVGILETL